MLLVQVYVDDIIFGSTNDDLCKRFAKIMQNKFEMSLMGELKYFLGLQVDQRIDGIFICQSKYLKELLKSITWRIHLQQGLHHLQLSSLGHVTLLSR